MATERTVVIAAFMCPTAFVPKHNRLHVQNRKIQKGGRERRATHPPSERK